MKSDNNEEGKRETEHSHLVQACLPISFVIIYVLDQIFLISVGLNDYISLILRIILFSVVLFLAFILMKLSHDALFHSNKPSNTLITDGILGHVRNPLYLGVLLIYVAFLFLSISLICLVFFIIIISIYNNMVNHEERVLESLFGEEYLAYKKRVPKWIPKLKK
ncbi:MAG: methyltransferase family protein [Promethearchaeota archaeon]